MFGTDNAMRIMDWALHEADFTSDELTGLLKRSAADKALFKQGREYPIEPEDGVRFWAKGAYDGMTAIGVKVFEVSQVRRRVLDQALVDERGALRGQSRVQTDHEHIELTVNNLSTTGGDIITINIQIDLLFFKLPVCIGY